MPISIMSKLFQSRQSNPEPLGDHHSPYSALLEQQDGRQSRDKQPSPGDYSSRPWLGVAERRMSWPGERPPTRKLVKEMNGSGRPSFSLELSDSDGEKEKGIVQRQIAKLKALYRRDK